MNTRRSLRHAPPARRAPWRAAFARPTNCGYIPNGSYGDPIEGPLERELVSYLPPYEALAHLLGIYKSICTSLLLPNSTLSTEYSDMGPGYWGPSLYHDNFIIKITIDMGFYCLCIEYEYGPNELRSDSSTRGGYGRYKCYGVIDRASCILAIHHIYGVGNLLSMVEMVKSYCDVQAPGLMQCRGCWYGDGWGKYCGLGLEMDTGICSLYKVRTGFTNGPYP